MCQLDVWLHPEFGFAVTTVNMYMHPSFFAGEKKESKAPRTKNCRTHYILPVPSGYAQLWIMLVILLRNRYQHNTSHPVVSIMYIGSALCLLNPHLRIVIRFAGEGVGAVRNQDIGLGPVGLQGSGFDGCDLDHAVHLADVGAYGHAGSIL